MRLCRALLVFVLLIDPCLLFGQSPNAALTGVVDDPSKAVVVGAQVTAINTETGVKSSTITNVDGVYAIRGLLPGTYRIEVDKQGFKGIIEPGVVLHVQDIVQLNFHMALGSMTETITVEANGLNINTTDASVSAVIDRQFVENLPLNGRTFQSLLYLSPGVTPNVASANSAYAQGQFVVNGQRGDANYWMVDGVGANVGMGLSIPGASVSGAIGATNALGGTSALVSVDALQEFRIETSTYGPEFGRAPGGQISIQTRSGTNQFHGSVFDYFRNTVLDASDWFANANGLPKAAEKQNDFGGVLGGPIIKDRTFFFFSYEGLRLRLPETFLGTVPDMASRATAIPAMQPYLNMYPLPKPGGADVPGVPGVAPYGATASIPGTADAYSLRMDHQLLRNLNLFARYNHAPSSVEQRGDARTAANTGSTVTSITKTATVGTTWAESANIIDDLRFNYSVSGGRQFYNSDSFGGGTPFPSANLLATGFTYQNSDVLLIPSFGINMSQYHGILSHGFQHQYNLVDSLSVQSASHSLKFGVDYRRLSPTADNAYEQVIPLFDNMADMAAGKSFLTLVYQNAPQTFVLRNLGLFAQDTWRVSRRLNLTYGLRWDVDFAPTNERGFGFAAVMGFSTTDLSELALAAAGTRAYSTRYGNVAPRIGGAYQISTDPSWGLVLRGGFGVFYGLASTEIFNNNFEQGYYPVGAFNAFTTYNALQYVPFPTPPDVTELPTLQPPNIQNGQTLFGFDPHLNVPYALEWNVAIEQSLGKAQTLSLSYVGASDKRLLASEYINNPNPNSASANLIGNAGTSNYQALQARFQRRLTNGLQALFSYTWSHSIDTGSYGAYANGGLADVNANWGDSDFDIRHAFTGAVTYNVPMLKNNFFTRAITGGWSMDNIVQINSGPPIDVQDANFSALSHENSAVLIRPDVVPGQPLYLSGSQYPGGKGLSSAAFTDPPTTCPEPTTCLPIRQGDLGRNALRAFGLTQWDFAARRGFRINERINLQFRAELFNILNHPNFGPFNNQFQLGNMYFGQSTQMLNQYSGGGSGGTGAGSGTQNSLYTLGGPRSVSLSLKLLF